MFHQINSFKSVWNPDISSSDLSGTIRLASRPGGNFLAPIGKTMDFPQLGYEIELDRNWPHWEIGKLAGRSVILAVAPRDSDAPAGLEWFNPRSLFGLLKMDKLNALSRASVLASWNDHHKYCGRCGTATAINRNETSRICPSCKHSVYPRLSPAVIVRITDGDNILLAHNHRFSEGVYSCVSGYVDPGESPEQTVLREILEEIGLEADQPRYITSQAWPFPHSLMMGFETKARGTPVPDGVEITDAQWFSVKNLPKISRQGTIARYLIDQWIEGFG